MIDLTEKTIKPAGERHDVVCGAHGAAPDAHESLDNSLSSIIGNARMIALDIGGRGGNSDKRLAAIIDNARKISLIVHQSFGSGRPAVSNNISDNSQPGGRIEGGAGERPCWI